jgi:AcrR family transcriptional regulator
MSSEQEDQIMKLIFDVKPSKTELKKNEIIKNVIHLIATIGIEQTSFENVGKQLGMTKANVAYYFKNKDEMIHFAIKYITITAQTITIQNIQTAKTMEEQIKAYIKAAFEWAKLYPEQMSVMMLFFYYSTIYPNYAELYFNIRQAGKKRIADLLKSDNPKLNTKQAIAKAHLIQAIITGKLVDHYTTGYKSDLKQIEIETIRQVMELI